MNAYMPLIILFVFTMGIIGVIVYGLRRAKAERSAMLIPGIMVVAISLIFIAVFFIIAIASINNAPK